MGLPADFGTGHVTGTFVTLAGDPVVGWLEFTLDPQIQALIDAAHETVIMPSPLRVDLDVDGAFAVDLPATDDPDINPTGFSYIVKETFTNALGREYSIVVPVDGSLDISQVVIAAPAPAITTIAGPPGPEALPTLTDDFERATGAPVHAFTGQVWTRSGNPSGAAPTVAVTGFGNQLLCPVDGFGYLGTTLNTPPIVAGMRISALLGTVSGGGVTIAVSSHPDGVTGISGTINNSVHCYLSRDTAVIQKRITTTGGSFVYSVVGGSVTVPGDASVAVFQAAVDASTLAGRVTVGGSTGLWTVTFVGPLAGLAVGPGSIDDSGLTSLAGARRGGTVYVSTTTPGSTGVNEVQLLTASATVMVRKATIPQLDISVEHDFEVAYDGDSVSLEVDGQLVASAVDTDFRWLAGQSIYWEPSRNVAGLAAPFDTDEFRISSVWAYEPEPASNFGSPFGAPFRKVARWAGGRDVVPASPAVVAWQASIAATTAPAGGTNFAYTADSGPFGGYVDNLNTTSYAAASRGYDIVTTANPAALWNIWVCYDSGPAGGYLNVIYNGLLAGVIDTYSASPAQGVIVGFPVPPLAAAVDGSKRVVLQLGASRNSSNTTGWQTRVRRVTVIETAVPVTVLGLTDCSGSPNYPAATIGDAYIVSVAGKIGGAAGNTVAVGDVFYAKATNAGGSQASVGASWATLTPSTAAAVAANTAAIAAETARAEAAEAAISSTVAEVETDLGEIISSVTAEASTARSAEAANAAAITSEAATARAAESANAAAITAEASTARAAESTLTANLATEVTARTATDANVTEIEADLGELVAADAAEAAARAAADSTLTTNLAAEASTARAAESANATAITNEASTARAAESTLTTNLASEVTNRGTAVTAEATARAAADSTLTTNLAAEATTARAAEAANAAAITAEAATARAAEAVAGGYTPTAVKTTTYTAAANDLVPCDTTSGGFTVTLPNAPADKTRVAVKHVIQGGSNVVTVACGGSDVFNKAGGATTLTLSLLAQAVVLQYKASGAIWYILADDLALAQLDLRFLGITAAPTIADGSLTPAKTAGTAVITTDSRLDRAGSWKNQPSTFKKWRAALQTRATVTAVHVAVGDSVTEGEYGTPITRYRNTLAHFNNGRTSIGWINGTTDTYSLLPYKFTLTTGAAGTWANQLNARAHQDVGLCGYSYSLANGGVLRLQALQAVSTWVDAGAANGFPIRTSSIDFHWTKQHSGACDLQFWVTVDGVLTLVKTVTGSEMNDATIASTDSGWKWTWTGARRQDVGAIEVRATGSGTAAIFDGCYIDDADTVRVYNAGHVGWQHALVTPVTSSSLGGVTNNSGHQQFLAKLQPDLITDAHGINDDYTGGDPTIVNGLMSGYYNWATAAGRSFTGTTSNGSLALVGTASNFTQRDVGAYISGANIPAGAQIVKVTDATNATMSIAATGATTTVALVGPTPSFAFVFPYASSGTSKVAIWPSVAPLARAEADTLGAGFVSMYDVFGSDLDVTGTTTDPWFLDGAHLSVAGGYVYGDVLASALCDTAVDDRSTSTILIPYGTNQDMQWLYEDGALGQSLGLKWVGATSAHITYGDYLWRMTPIAGVTTNSPGAMELLLPHGMAVFDSSDNAGVIGANFGLYANVTDPAPYFFVGHSFGFPFIGLGGGAATVDALFGRATISTVNYPAAGLSGAEVLVGGRAQLIQAQTGTSYTPVAADRSKIITRSNASASTQTWPQDSDATIPLGTIIEVRNIGAGTVTHSAGTGATVTGALVQLTGQAVQAIKVAANTWHLGGATGRSVDGQALDTAANTLVIAPGTHAATTKATPVDADELPLVDSAASNVLKKLTWSNLKATLKTYFDGIYASSSSVSSVLYTKTTEVSTNATTNRTLSTYAVPAGTLSTNGDYLEVEYLLTCPSLATANNPTPTVSVGGVVMLGPSFSTQSGIVAYASGRMTITRLTSTTVRVAWIGNTTGLTTQPANWTAMYGSGADVTVSDLASNTLTVLLQGKNSAGTNSTAACMTQELTRITYNPGSALS